MHFFIRYHKTVARPLSIAIKLVLGDYDADTISKIKTVASFWIQPFFYYKKNFTN
ncbi:hypothetical protein Riean_0459 [Riemerella anatipestifer ATCC 11845 = DSM 15868]|uniref:Uncharacterized protein n=1 Tax=Riemerella anatipestifer (strain ATCC 11845 / DSM 15868 / JCM 9532 / NCTC 11014) TaxID=693978 RepID=E4T9E6_RIEAD|nr:hypothetical protein Riean_0459 [Riemerella anatipestifer ATCC 11845 = DSM 15868]AFD55641.1 hypothetical protein RA0C_0681 [Riemerella anatipestifer ATCC 11845 = DSM 15868]AGC40465.1 hypothetical protein G148_1161 [Riemerella anatipestifer RA-CH-2]EFT35297.1 hypothetical protein RAYM_05690 [Riemerella anatipestifer RA-YM]SNV54769.1 Uncharacterised protein [Riemerella anatipestifer]